MRRDRQRQRPGGARGVAIGEMKADGIEYDERMALLEEITWPQPLRELLEALYETYRQTHPWLPDDALGPKSVVREMWEQGMGFTDFVGRYQLARSEGLVLRYLTDAYRTLRQTVPESHRAPEVEDVIEWLGETVRQTDSSLLDEWEALTDPTAVPVAPDPLEPQRPPALTSQPRAFRVLVRNALFRRVELVALRRPDLLGELDPDVDWVAALEAYSEDHQTVGNGPDARGPQYFQVTEEPGRWVVRQVLDDPAGDHDWALHATVDLAASDEEGTAVIRVVDAGRKD